MAGAKGNESKAGGGASPPSGAAGFDFAGILAIADALPVMVAYCDANQIYRFCNRGIADWFEKPRADILGRSIREIMGEAAYTLRADSIAAALAGERQWFAASYQHPTRGLLTTQADYVPHFADGRVVGIVMLVEDLTEQRAADLALRESEARFRRIADSAPAPMWVTGADGTREFVNQAFLDFLGLTGDRAGQHDWLDALHPDDAGQAFADYQAGIQSGDEFEMTARVRRFDGAWRWMRSVSQPRRSADGKTVGFIGVANDETSAKEAELALRKTIAERTAEISASEARFQTIFDSVSTVIVLMSPDGTIIDVNRTAAPWRRGGERGGVGLPLWDSPTLSFYPDQHRAIRALVARAARGERVEQMVTLDRPGVPVAHLELTLLPVRDEKGKVSSLILEARDITELKAAQDQLRQSQKMEALGQLTGGIAHDFNNLLTVVVGGLDMILRQNESERVARYATNAMAAAERGARLTAQLLAFSRVQRLEIRPIKIAPLVDEARPLLRNVLGPGIGKTIDIDPDLPAVMADPTQLEVALLNLAINARDAMAEGGQLTIAGKEMRVDEDSELEPGDYVALTISDTGAGMAPDVAARAFEPFFTTKEAGKGTGLGLSMVYGMARQSGGTARIESAPGTGTSVHLYFRTATESDEDGAVTEDEERADEANPTARSVLVIDDDDSVRSMIAATLAEQGYEVAEAADGATGISVFEDQRPDVVVIDYVMPGMTGAEVAERVLAIRPGQPILFVSGYSETEAINRIAPRAPLLPKPFRADALAASVRGALEAAA